MPFLEPRPKREDVPDNVDPADILHEMRLFIWEWRYWRSEVNGDLGFLRRFRSALNDSVRFLVLSVPIIAATVATLVALRLI